MPTGDVPLMHTYDLFIPSAHLPHARQVAQEYGARLLADPDKADVFVLLATSLPPALAGYQVKASAAEKPLKSVYWALSVPFADRALVYAHGARWDETTRCFCYKGPTLPTALLAYQALPFSWEAAVERAQRGVKPGPLLPNADAITPRPHQTVAAQAALAVAKAGYPGFLLADEVGLGKTISAWLGAQLVAKQLNCKNVLIVSPLSVVAHWRQTLQRLGSTIPDILAINYDRLDKLFEMPAGVKAKSKKGVAKRAEAPEVDLIIFDESHKLKNPTTARSKLAAKLAQKAKFCFYLSATAGQNPLELAYLSALIAKSTGASSRSLKDFEQWCISQGLGLKQGKFGAWEWSGTNEDCDRLRRILYEGHPPAGLRRRPEEIQGWPEINRILLPQELSPEERQLYHITWDEFKVALRSKRAVKSTPAAKQGRAGALVEALRFRQKSSELRVKQTVAMALDLVETGVKPAISCAFKESAAAIKTELESKKLRCAFIHGSLDPVAREAQRLQFQKGEADIVLFTIEEGISLHQGEYAVDQKPRALLIHDLRWSAIQMAQIEGRTHRDGKFAQAYWLAGEGTVEMNIAKRVAEKTVAMKSLSGDADADLDEAIMQVLLTYAE